MEQCYKVNSKIYIYIGPSCVRTSITIHLTHCLCPMTPFKADVVDAFTKPKNSIGFLYMFLFNNGLSALNINFGPASDI